MKRLRAFVGHSFEDNDQLVVRSFLDYFNSIKEPFDFEWEHAENAELKELSIKVKEKMTGKNLFIGILTIKDYRVKREDLHKKGKRLKKIYALGNIFAGGSSDWIIQESGYALGKDMDTLFLIEEGIRFSAGLQGNLENIPFTRENPALAFPKINQMLNSIPKKADPDIAIASPISSQGKEAEVIQEKSEEDKEEEATPEPIVDIFRSLWKVIVDEGNFNKGKEKLEEYLELHKEDADFDPINWWAIFSYLKGRAGSEGAFGELEKMAQDNPDNPRPNVWLGNLNMRYEMYPKAAEKYLAASEKEKGNVSKIKYIGEASKCYALDKDFGKSYEILLNQFNNTRLDNECYYNLYKYLSDVAKSEKKRVLFSAFAEKALSFSPWDHDLRFSLAFDYMDNDDDALSLYHYKILTTNHPFGNAWNNLGVAYNRLDMKIESIYSYEIASEQYKETLAMSNLAEMYMDQGFLRDARKILKEAQLQESPHENVSSSIARISRIKKNEEKKEGETIEDIKMEREFLPSFAEAYAMPASVNIEGEWDSTHGIIPMAVNGKKIYGKSETPIKLSFGLAGLLAPETSFTRPKPSDDKRMVEFDGNISNRAIEFEINISTSSHPHTLLTDIKPTHAGFMIVKEDGQTIEVMERDEKNEKTTFYEMKKVQKEKAPSLPPVLDLPGPH